MQVLLDAYELYGQSIHDFSFDWIDLGSFGSPDAYHLPLICLPGNVMCIEGRSDGDDAYSVYSSIIKSVLRFINSKRMLELQMDLSILLRNT